MAIAAKDATTMSSSNIKRKSDFNTARFKYYVWCVFGILVIPDFREPNLIISCQVTF
jgi:hypothetical protein